MGARAGCCCGCAFVDHDLADPDGAVVTEQFVNFYLQDVLSTSSQEPSDGSTFGCKANLRSAQPPCRDLVLDYKQDQTRVFCGRCVVDLSAGPAPYMNTIFQMDWDAGSSRYFGPGPYHVELNGSGSTMTLTVYDLVTGLLAATYTGSLPHGWNSALNIGGINWLDQGVITLTGGGGAYPATVLLYAQEPAGGYPYHGIYAGQSFAQEYWRFYDQTTFDPDGSPGPALGLKVSSAHIYDEFTGFDGITTVNSGLNLFPWFAIQQGANRAVIYNWPHSPALFTDPGSLWRFSTISDQAWASITWTKPHAGAFLTPTTFTPDLTAGADPITFGIYFESNGSSGVSHVTSHYRFDEICLQIKH
jgi:hypothetical protein